MRNIKKMTNGVGKRIYYKVAAILTAAALFCVQGQASEIEAPESVLVPALSDGTEEMAGQEDLQLYAQAAVLMDADSGRVLYGKNPEKSCPWRAPRRS